MFAPGGKLPWGLAIGGGATFVMAIFMGWYGFPKVIRGQINSQKGLKAGSESRDLWRAFPEPLDFKIHLFNLTNPQQVHDGAKPIVQQIGPYFYAQFKHKENLADNMQEDTVSYNVRVRWYFKPEKSNGLTGDEMITIPHPLILGTINTVERTTPGMLGLLNKALPAIYRQPENIFLTAKAREILFDGVMVNCSVTDFAAKAVCGQLRKEAKDLKWINDNEFLFSLFGPQNNTLNPNRVTIKRGIRDAQEVGRVVAYKGLPKLEFWAGEPCNNLSGGTDSTIFPPALTREGGVLAFGMEICRSILAKYSEDVKYEGIPGYRYTADLGDVSSNPDDKCFCVTEKCLKKGALDLFPCLGSPVIATLPHFYMSDPEYQNSVEGLSPSAESHEIFMIFEPMSGTPLHARKRLQFNMYLHSIDKIALVKNVPDALVPLFWVEEGIALPPQYVDMIKSQLFRALQIIEALKWILLCLGAGTGGAGAFLLYKKKQQEGVITAPHGRPSTKVMSVSAVSEANGIGHY